VSQITEVEYRRFADLCESTLTLPCSFARACIVRHWSVTKTVNCIERDQFM